MGDSVGRTTVRAKATAAAAERYAPSAQGVAWEGAFQLENVAGDRMQLVDEHGVVVDDLESPGISHRHPYQKVFSVEPWYVSADAVVLRVTVERRGTGEPLSFGGKKG